jgi:transposase InsO family protein
MTDEREQNIEWINEAMAAGARQAKACNIINLCAKTYQRWCNPQHQKDGRLIGRNTPHNKLNGFERKAIIELVNKPEYAHLPPQKIVATLADKGIYLASEATIYRLLREQNQLHHRGKSAPNRRSLKPKACIATAPNKIYTWDITYLPTTIKGQFFYLYLVMDIYSRKIVGWQIHECEASELAADLLRDICKNENIQQQQIVLHSDNGSPMKGATMLATLQQLGVIPSFSRPSVSNDNPYSESLFRTLKYRPEYPEKLFTDLTAARAWVNGFVRWYNKEHQHSAIKFVTPEQRHLGKDVEILAHRTEVYEQAKAKHPERWSGNTRDWSVVGEVLLNPDKANTKNEQKKAA